MPRLASEFDEDVAHERRHRIGEVRRVHKRPRGNELRRIVDSKNRNIMRWPPKWNVKNSEEDLNGFASPKSSPDASNISMCGCHPVLSRSNESCGIGWRTMRCRILGLGFAIGSDRSKALRLGPGGERSICANVRTARTTNDTNKFKRVTIRKVRETDVVREGRGRE